MQVKQRVNSANIMQMGSKAVRMPQTVNTENDGKDFASFLKPAAEKKAQPGVGRRFARESGMVEKSKEQEKPKLQEKLGTQEKTGVQKDTDRPEGKPPSVNEENHPVSQGEKPQMEGAVQSADPEEETVFVVLTDGQCTQTASPAPNEEETESLLETIAQLFQVIENQFGLTQEEFADKLQSFDMEPKDLLNLEGIRTFFLKMENAEPYELLTNEELNLQLNDFANEMEQVIKTFAVPLETVENYLKDASLLKNDGRLKDVKIAEHTDLDTVMDYAEETNPEIAVNLSDAAGWNPAMDYAEEGEAVETMSAAADATSEERVILEENVVPDENRQVMQDQLEDAKQDKTGDTVQRDRERVKPDGKPVTEKEPEVTVKYQRTPRHLSSQNQQARQETAPHGETTDTASVLEEKNVFREETGSKKTSFENPFLQAVNESLEHITETAAAEETHASGRQIIEQIVQQVRVEMNQTTSSMELQLYPEHLGKIQIQVVSKDGVMTARIAAESETARQAIENGLSNLKEAMEQQDLKVDAIEVMVSTTGFSQENEGQNMEEQKKSAKTNRPLRFMGTDEEEVPQEENERERMRAVGSSVSYSA